MTKLGQLYYVFIILLCKPSQKGFKTFKTTQNRESTRKGKAILLCLNG